VSAALVIKMIGAQVSERRYTVVFLIEETLDCFIKYRLCVSVDSLPVPGLHNRLRQQLQQGDCDNSPSRLRH
jgi:hypothetical protein